MCIDAVTDSFTYIEMQRLLLLITVTLKYGIVFCVLFIYLLGQCIITYWETGNWMGAVRCPSCRQQVRFVVAKTEHLSIDD